MKVVASVAGAWAGTLTVASLHEAFRRITPNAPRMDVLDIELIKKGLKTINRKAPPAYELQRWAVGGELVGDTSYYTLAGIGGEKGIWLRGALLGLVAGVSAVVLPKTLGLPDEPSSKTLATQLMTVGLYVAGGLVAAGVTKMVDNLQRNSKELKKQAEQSRQDYASEPIL